MHEQYGKDYTKETGSVARQQGYTPTGQPKEIPKPDSLTTISGCLAELLQLQKETIEGLNRLYQFNHMINGVVLDDVRKRIEEISKDFESVRDNETVIMKRLTTTVHIQAIIRDCLSTLIHSLEAIL